MEGSNLLAYLLQQSPVIVVMGMVIYWLKGRYEKSEDEKTELAKNVIKLTVAYETKLDNDNTHNVEIKNLLIEIRGDIKRWEK